MTGFTPEVRAAIRQGAIDSAAVIVPLILDVLPDLKTVIDVGCGEGAFTLRFNAHPQMRAVVGVDFDAPAGDTPVGLTFLSWDFEQRPIPFALEGALATRETHPFDLAVSLEVAEHLTPERGESFIAELCMLAPIVLFSAAIPGQGGVNHVNEQWPGYWSGLFAEHGYTTSGFLRWLIWDDDRVENWYRQNLLLAVSNDVPFDSPDWLFDVPPRAVVHPVLWSAYRL